MSAELKSEGKCLYCGKMFSQQEITKHLAVHLAAIEKEHKLPLSGAWHLKIESGEMFLDVLVGGSATFKTLDKFLRNIWVECCDHLSAFQHKNFKVRMAHTFDDVCSPRLKIGYEYDFGDTTYLEVTAIKRYSVTPPKKVLLLSRNEPLKLMCAECKKAPAEFICPFCLYKEYAFYCAECSELHEKKCPDYGEDTAAPVVNSPRMGVCGYAGGVIDKQRDGFYLKFNVK
jgi:hypothetical protein